MTKTYLYRSLVTCLILVFAVSVVSSQRTSTRSKRTERTAPKFTDQLWYGGGFALGFYGGSYSGVQSSEFYVGVSPMVGYKINEIISIGPRFEVSLLTGRYDLGREVLKGSFFNYGAGIFARAKFFQYFFAHTEYGYQNRAIPYFVNGEIETERQGNDQFLLGLGYNSGYPWGTEISILYDFLAPEDTVDLPIAFRFGLTYKF